MGKRNRYRDHVDPAYQHWGQVYSTFPGVDECARLILDGKPTGAQADIIHQELAENAKQHVSEMIEAFYQHRSDAVGLYMLMALETAALPESVDFLADVLRDGDATHASYAKRALDAIDTKESRPGGAEADQDAAGTDNHFGGDFDDP